MITPIWCLHTQRLRGYCVDEINDYAKHENFANVSVRNRFSFFVWALVGFFLSYKMIKNLSNYQATFYIYNRTYGWAFKKHIFKLYLLLAEYFACLLRLRRGGGRGRGGKKYLRLFMLLSGLGACWLSGLRNDNEHRFHLQNKQTSCANTMKNWADITKYYIL